MRILAYIDATKALQGTGLSLALGLKSTWEDVGFRSGFRRGTGEASGFGG